MGIKGFLVEPLEWEWKHCNLKTVLGITRGVGFRVERFWIEPLDRHHRRAHKEFWVKPFTDGSRCNPLCGVIGRTLWKGSDWNLYKKFYQEPKRVLLWEQEEGPFMALVITFICQSVLSECFPVCVLLCMLWLCLWKECCATDKRPWGDATIQGKQRLNLWDDRLSSCPLCPLLRSFFSPASVCISPSALNNHFLFTHPK